MMNILMEILAASWKVFHESAIYMLFGFFVSGVAYVLIKPEKVSHYLGRGKIRPVFLSAIAGIPIPLCSCGVVPAALTLKKQGANSGATLSFLISTPESGFDSIPITYALMDPIITIMRPLAAFVTAVIAGITENFLGPSKNFSEKIPENPPAVTNNCGCKDGGTCQNNPTKAPFLKTIGSGLKYAFVDLLGDIGKWFILGIFLAGLISYFIPDTLFESYLSNNFIAMLVMLLAGMPMYVCATSSTPIAAALVLKGLNPGAALVFLLSGPATNVASLSMISGLFGKRSLIIYLGSIAMCSLTIGYITDMIYFALGTKAVTTTGQVAEIFPNYVEIAGAVVLAALLIFSTMKAFKLRGANGSC